MLNIDQVENYRRSAAMSPLPSMTTVEILEDMDRLLRERAQIAKVLADLPSSFGAVRSALNDLQRLVSDD